MKDAPKTYINCLFIFSANTLVAAFFIALLWPIRNAFSISSKASKGSISKTSRNKGAISYPSKVGRFIRKTSIDELPQFWNILKGDMSLVGTRPPTVDEFERYEAKHKCRLSMTPGLTGLWQVSGRSDIKDFDEVVQLDMQYIDNWSILKDIKILLLTVGIVITGKGSR